MAKGTFGERLKRERELREVSLKEVSSATRISERFLGALENEDWERLPGGVFGRGFVRSIARYLGLSEESLLAEYDLARGENAKPVSVKPEERIPSPPKWIPAALVLGVLLLLIGLIFGALYGLRKFKEHRASKKSSSSELFSPVPQTLLPTTTEPSALSRTLLLELNSDRTPPLSTWGSFGRIVLTVKNLGQVSGGVSRH